MNRKSSFLHIGALWFLLMAAQAWAQGSLAPASKDLTANDVKDVVSSLREAVKDYIFPEIAPKLAEQLAAHEKDYILLTSPSELAKRLTADMRAIGQDTHLQVTVGEELAIGWGDDEDHECS